jgi:hypothetical protein
MLTFSAALGELPFSLASALSVVIFRWIRLGGENRFSVELALLLRAIPTQEANSCSSYRFSR